MAKAQFNRIFTKAEVDELRTDALPFYYPEIAGEPARPDPGSHKTKNFIWANREDFARDISDLVNVDITKAQGDALYSLLRTVDKNLGNLLGQNPVTQTLPSEEVLESKAAEEREAARQKAIQDSNEKVRQAIAKQEELHAKLEASKPKIYVKVEEPAPTELSENAQKMVDGIRSAPKEYVPLLKDSIKTSIIPSMKGLSDEQIDLIATDAAYKLVSAVTNEQEFVDQAREVAILQAISTDNVAVPKVITDADTLSNLRIGTNEYSQFENMGTFTTRLIVGAVDKSLAQKYFPEFGDFKVTLSETQLEGFTRVFNPDGFVQGYGVFLSNNLEFFGRLVGLPIDKFEHELISKATTFLEGQIIKNFPSTAAFFSAPESKLLLSTLGLGTTTITLPAQFSTFFIENSSALPVINFFSSGLGINFAVASPATAVAGEMVAPAVGDALVTGGTTMATEGTIAAAGAAGAVPSAGITAAIAVVAIVGKKIVDKVKDFVAEHGEQIRNVVFVGTGILVGGGIGLISGFGIIFGGIIGGGAGFLTSSFVAGGSAGINSALSSFGGGVLTFFDALWATFLAGIGAPIIAILIGFPAAVVIILFIINAGAYVVPPGAALLNSTNPYISVEKTANPGGQLPSPTSITYTVTISAKKDSLTGIVITPSCTATKKGGSLNCPAEQIPAPPASIAAGSPFTFTFTSDYGPQYQDALVSDEIKVNATSVSGGKVEETGTASVCFGKCPLDCYDFSDPSWNQVPSIKSQYIAAASKISGQYSDFSIKVCKAGTIKMVYSNNDPAAGSCGGIYGRNISNSQINFNKCASQTGGQEGVNYIFTHEITHHIQYTNGHWFTLYKDKVPSSEWNICTYGGGDPSEQMAEADALYIANPVIYANPCGVSMSNFHTKYPYNYNFVKNYMYAP